MRYRYCKQEQRMLPIDQWMEKYGRRRNKTHYVHGEIEPYKAISGDMTDKWITSRKEHKEFLRRNDFVEVGNEHDYMTRHKGMTPDNPWVNYDERKHEEQICQDLKKNLERLKSR